MALRRYSDHDVALILRRALELEEQRPRPDVPDGVTLADLREIAREVGIDPRMVEKAAAELDVSGSRTARTLATESAVVREIREVPRALSAEEIHELIRMVDRTLTEQGTVTQALGEVRWTSRGKFRSTQVAVKPTAGETVISVEESLGDTKWPLLGVPASWGLVIGLGMGSDGGAGTALALGIVMAAAGAVVGGGIWQLVLDHHVGRVRSLMKRLLGQAQGDAAPGAEAPGEARRGRALPLPQGGLEDLPELLDG